MGIIVYLGSLIMLFLFGLRELLEIPFVFQAHSIKIAWWVLLYPLGTLMLLNLGAGTELGESKVGRIILGFAAFFNIFAIAGHLTIILSSAILWNKIMGLTMIGVTTEQKISMAKGLTTLPLLVWVVVGFLGGRIIFTKADIVDRFLGARPMKLGLKFDKVSLSKLGIEIKEADSFFGRLGKLFNKKPEPVDSYIEGAGDLTIGTDKQTGKPVIISAQDLTMNVVAVGSIGSGKTQGCLSPWSVQHIRNPDIGGVVLEPKGTWLRSVPKTDGTFTVGLYEICRRFGRDVDFVNPHDPNTAVIQPMLGHPDMAAETVRIALKSLFGDQEGFFDEAQGLVAVQVVRLLKYLSVNPDFNDFGRMLREPDALENNVHILKARLAQAGITDKYDQRNVLITWYENKYYGEQRKQFQEYTMGLQIQVERLLANEFFRRCIIPDKNNQIQKVINLDDHFASKRWLLINTDDGLLGDYSKVLARMFLVPAQYAVQRRFNNDAYPGLHPIYIDELGTYIYPEFVVFATKSREYNAPIITAFQSLGQLLDVGGRSNNKAFHDVMLGTLNSKIICSRLVHADVEYFSKSLGTMKEMIKTYSANVAGKVTSFIPERSGKTESYQEKDRAMFQINDIKFMESNEIIFEIIKDRKLTPARLATTKMVDISHLPPAEQEDIDKARITAVIPGAEEYVVPKLDNEREFARNLAVSQEIKKKDDKSKVALQGKKPATKNSNRPNQEEGDSGKISPNLYQQYGAKSGDDLMGK